MDEPIDDSKTVSRDTQLSIHVNHLGYTPDASKRCILEGGEADTFHVRRLPGDEFSYEGELSATTGDFGSFSVGEFDAVSQPGTYYVRAGDARSYPFRIANDVYDDLIAGVVSHFGRQRCGASETGYLSPCHTDDGIRKDTGAYQDVTGGWHDATDLRKWVDATLHGLVGLVGLLERGVPWDGGHERVLEEIRWGNRYFLAMQEPDGHLLHNVGGDVLQHSDGNRWTDNEVQTDTRGLDPRLIEPADRDRDPVAVVGDGDDRIIDTKPAPAVAQYVFVATEAHIARLLADEDPEYAEMCLDAAKECFEWCLSEKLGTDVGRHVPENHRAHPAFECAPAGILGALARAAVSLYRKTEEDRYAETAAAAADRLVDLQASGGELTGFFIAGPGVDTPYRQIFKGQQPLLGLCSVVNHFDDRDRAERWREALERYVESYLGKVANRNVFGLVPYGAYEREDPGGDRRLGNRWYRYTMHPSHDWWVGINANVGAAGVGLLEAAAVLDDPSLAVRAQRQIDWVLGMNPQGSSTVQGFGYEQPEMFETNAYWPDTPHSRGGVMNGLGGTESDEITRRDGAWQTAEYWTPMCGYVLWLAAELRERA